MKYLSQNEVSRFLKTIEKDTKYNFMFRIMLLLGLRVGEAVQLKISDFDFSSKEVRIRALKNGIDRTYSLPDKIWKLFKRWLRQREVDSDYIFPGRLNPNSHITTFAVQRMFKLICDEAKIFNKSVHAIRHTTAMVLAEQNANMYRIRNWLRHRSITSSAVYLTAVEDKHFEAEAQQYFSQIL